MKKSFSSARLDNALIFDLFQKKMRRVWKQVRTSVNLQSTDCQGYSLLHMSVFLGLRPLTEFLIRQGADVNAQSKTKFTPLHLAAHQANEEMVKLLLAYGARTDLKDHLHRTPLEYMKTLDFSNKRNAARSCMDLLKKPIRVQTHVPVDFKDSLLGHTR